MRWTILFLLLSVMGCSSNPQAADAPLSGEGCQSPLGFIPEGHTLNGYREAVAHAGTGCESGVLTCLNGQWSGAYIYPSCTRLP